MGFIIVLIKILVGNTILNCLMFQCQCHTWCCCQCHCSRWQTRVWQTICNVNSPISYRSLRHLYKWKNNNKRIDRGHKNGMLNPTISLSYSLIPQTSFRFGLHLLNGNVCVYTGIYKLCHKVHTISLFYKHCSCRELGFLSMFYTVHYWHTLHRYPVYKSYHR